MRFLLRGVLLAGLAVSLPPALPQPTTEAGNAATTPEAEPPSEGESGASLAWKWANFVVLLVGIGYLVRKNVMPYFAARSLEIRKGMIEADEMRAEAESKVAAVEARLQNLDLEIAALRKEASQEQHAETERLRQQTLAEIAKVDAHARQEIEAAGKTARMELKRYSAELAIGLAEQKIRARMSPENESLLVEGFLKNLGQPMSHVQST